MDEEEGLLLKHTELPPDDVGPEVLAATHPAVALTLPFILAIAPTLHVSLHGKEINYRSTLNIVPQMLISLTHHIGPEVDRELLSEGFCLVAGLQVGAGELKVVVDCPHILVHSQAVLPAERQ